MGLDGEAPGDGKPGGERVGPARGAVDDDRVRRQRREEGGNRRRVGPGAAAGDQHPGSAAGGERDIQERVDSHHRRDRLAHAAAVITAGRPR
jgi:hypothetical protein